MPKTYQPHETERMQELAGQPLASFRSRALAFGVDMSLAACLVVIVVLLLPAIVSALTHILPPAAATAVEQWRNSKRDVNLKLNFEGYGLVYFVLFFGLSVYWGNGRTMGKRLLGIRVVSLVHHEMSLWHSIERALGYAASMAEFSFGFWQYFIHPNRRTVHDRMAETIVIQELRVVPGKPKRTLQWAIIASAIVVAAAVSMWVFRHPLSEFMRTHVKVQAGLPRE